MRGVEGAEQNNSKQKQRERDIYSLKLDFKKQGLLFFLR